MSNKSSNKSKMVAVLAASALALGAWSLMSGDEEGIAKADKLANQVWIDRVPDNDRDMITHLLLLDHPRAKNFGVLGRSSQWRHQVEVTRWTLKGSRLGLFFPQERHKAQLQARTWKCEGDAPAPFDLCLELKRGDRKVMLYSHHDWVVEPHGDVEDSYEELIESVDALRNLHEVEVDVLGERLQAVDSDDYQTVDTLSGILAPLSGPVDDED